MHTSEIVKNKRVKLGYSQRELAAKIGRKVGSIKQWEAGKQLPAENMALKILEGLEFNKEEIEGILKQLEREKRIKKLVVEISRKTELWNEILNSRNAQRTLAGKVGAGMDPVEALKEREVEQLEELLLLLEKAVESCNTEEILGLTILSVLMIAHHLQIHRVQFHKMIDYEMIDSDVVVWLHVAIANLFSGLCLYHLAIAELEEVVQQFPNSFVAHAHLSIAYKDGAKRSSNWEKLLQNAINTGKKAIELYNKRKDDRELYKSCIGAVAEAYYELGSDEAIKFYKEYVQMDKDYIWAYLRIVRLYLRKGDPNAIKWLKKALSCEPYLSLMEFMGDAAKKWAQFKDNKEFIKLINNLEKYKDVFGDEINPNAIRNVREALGM